MAPPLYEQRVPALDINQEAVDHWFDRITQNLSNAQPADLKKKFAYKGVIHGAAKRIELIAWDIATHVTQNIRPEGLKGQVAASSKRDAMETVNYSAYEEQIRRLVDKQIIGMEVRQPEGVYLVHKLRQDEESPEDWPGDKTRNETNMIRARLRKTIEQTLADDPYAKKGFGELLKQSTADAEAMLAHPLKQYALFKDLEEAVAARQTPDLPDALDGNPHARARFGVIRIALGEQAYAALAPAALRALVSDALTIDTIMRNAVAENSLNPHNIESVICKGILPLLYGTLGLDIAKAVVEQVIHITRVGLGRR